MTSKKIIVNESVLKRIMTEEILSEDVVSDILKNKELEKKIKDTTKDAIKNDKEIEKKVKSLVAASVNKLFLTLWQKNNFWKDTIMNN